MISRSRSESRFTARHTSSRTSPLRARISGGQYLSPWQQFALNLINAVIDERPIYFASSGNAAASLGMQPYLVRQGLAFRLNNGELSQEGTGYTRMVESPYLPVIGDWVDVERTRTLMDEVFVHRTGLPDEWTHWPDHATIGIPNYYAWVYMALVQAAIQGNDTDALDRYQSALAAGQPVDLAPLDEILRTGVG